MRSIARPSRRRGRSRHFHTEHGDGIGRTHRAEPFVVAVVTVVAVVLLYARLPFAARQFWAEDGREFFGDALRFGPIRSLGHSEAGYYLLVSRLGGVFASFVPIREAALTMWLWTARWSSRGSSQPSP